jgi:phosphate transport system substrate-binding protein
VAGLTAASALLLASACSASNSGGAVEVSGSSTVEPITSTVAQFGRFDVSVTAEGTTDGFARFCAGETSINNASVPIPGPGSPVDYVARCAENDVEFIELPIAMDALTLLRHEDNDFATDMTFDEVRLAWGPGSNVDTWADIRPGWPAEKISFVGRPAGSGTFEYFSALVGGAVGSIRDGYRATDDMAQLAGWIADDSNALGFMGVGNYLAADEDQRDVITNIAIDGVLPTFEAAQDGTYTPLTRPLFIYVAVEALDDEKIADFVRYYLEHVPDILPRVHFYALPEEAYELGIQRLENRITGSALGGDEHVTVDQLLAAMRRS